MSQTFTARRKSETEKGLFVDTSRLFVRRPSTTPRGSTTSSTEDLVLNHLKDRYEFGLAWIGLTYSPKQFMSNESKTILRNISGEIKFGHIMGLMGPSGCGKSTLLRCINGRIGEGLSADTEIYISVKRPIQTCFIVQDQKEHLLMNLTARESLLYASKIKNQLVGEDSSDSDSFGGESILSSTLAVFGLNQKTNSDHNSNVNKLLTDLNLFDCAETLVSDCSGGQQKRIVIALELVAEEKPNIICIDEPTSGLDSNAAEQVMECLQGLSREHLIGIITTIHQPNSDILLMFDSLYVLSKGGYCIYNGKPQLIREFLQKSNITISETQIPIEVLLKLASKTLFTDTQSEEFEVHEEIKALSKTTDGCLSELRLKCQLFGKLTDPRHITIGSLGFSFNDFWFLILRTFKTLIIRGWKSLLFFLVFELCLGASNSILFGKCGASDGCLHYNPYKPPNITCIPVDVSAGTGREPETFRNFKFLFFSLIMHNFLQLCYTVLTFPLEVRIFFNEQQNRWYSTGAYYWAKNIIDALIGLVFTSAYTLSTFIMTGQIGGVWDKRFGNVFEDNFSSIQRLFHRLIGLYLTSYLLSTFSSQGMSYTFSIIANKSLKICLLLGIGGNLLNSLFSGFLLPVHEMNAFLQQISYISYIKAAFEIQVLAVYGFDRCNTNLNLWPQMLYLLDLKEEDITVNMSSLVIQTILWRILALICLIIKTNDRKINFKLPFTAKNNKKSIQTERELNYI